MNHSPGNYRLMRVIALAQETLDRLHDEDGLITETEIEILTALGDEGVSVDSLLSALGRAALDARINVELISERMGNLRKRQDRAERHEETIRNTLLQAMQSLGLSTFSDPEFSASIRAGKPKVHITDAEALPETCVRVIREPDKRFIAEVLAAGGPVEGAVLSNGADSLTLRSK